MRKFIRELTRFLLLALPVLFIILPAWFYIYGFPPPKISTSISFNSKIEYIRLHHLNEPIGTLAIGSSMTLNNLHSQSIKGYFGNGYLNLSSWGQNIDEDYHLLQIFCKLYEIKHVLISSNYMDFTSTTKDIQYGLLTEYLERGFPVTVTKMNVKYLIKESKLSSYYRHNVTDYVSLHYDDCGGINFQSKNFNITPERWNGNKIEEFVFDTVQYQYLDSLAAFCKTKGIEFIFVESPFRNGYYSQLAEGPLEVLQTHVNKIESIITRHDQVFVNTLNQSWDDSLFVDYSHFNAQGAELFTKYILEEVDSARTSDNLSLKPGTNGSSSNGFSETQ